MSETKVPEKHESLWRLAAPPAVWAAHFLSSYGTAAIWCAKTTQPDAPLTPVRIAIAVYTFLGVSALAALGWDGYRRHRHPGGTTHHASDTPEDRHRFMGFATLLLSGLAAVAMLYEALVVVFIRSCR